MSFRLFVFSLTPPWYVVLATQALHALTFGGTHVASMQIIHRITPEAFRASGQTFLTALVGLGGVLGGVWAETYGLPGLFRMLAIVGAAATLLVFLGFAKWREDVGA